MIDYNEFVTMMMAKVSGFDLYKAEVIVELTCSKHVRDYASARGSVVSGTRLGYESRLSACCLPPVWPSC